MVVEEDMEVDTVVGMTAEEEAGMGAGQVAEEAAGATEVDMVVEQRAERSKTCLGGGERREGGYYRTDTDTL